MSASHKPSRRKPSATARLRRFWFVFALVFVAIGVGVYFAAMWPVLYPHRIAVSGNRVVTAEQILAAAAIDPQRNLWLQNPRAVTTRVEAIPYVDGAWLHRRLPADATIVVTERVPLAFVRADGEAMIIDRTLRVLSVEAAPPSLPRIETHLVSSLDPGSTVASPAVRALVVDLLALRRAGVDVRAIGFDRYGGLVATRADGVQILLGDDDDLPGKLTLLGPIEKQTAGGRPLRAIDLRTPATPVIVYRTS